MYLKIMNINAVWCDIVAINQRSMCPVSVEIMVGNAGYNVVIVSDIRPEHMPHYDKHCQTGHPTLAHHWPIILQHWDFLIKPSNVIYEVSLSIVALTIAELYNWMINFTACI